MFAKYLKNKGNAGGWDSLTVPSWRRGGASTVQSCGQSAMLQGSLDADGISGPSRSAFSSLP